MRVAAAARMVLPATCSRIGAVRLRAEMVEPQSTLLGVGTEAAMSLKVCRLITCSGRYPNLPTTRHLTATARSGELKADDEQEHRSNTISPMATTTSGCTGTGKFIESGFIDLCFRRGAVRAPTAWMGFTEMTTATITRFQTFTGERLRRTATMPCATASIPKPANSNATVATYSRRRTPTCGPTEKVGSVVGARIYATKSGG